MYEQARFSIHIYRTRELLYNKCSSMYEAGKILHSLPAELQLRRYSAGRSNKLMNTETYSLNYTDLNAMTRL